MRVTFRIDNKVSFDKIHLTKPKKLENGNLDLSNKDLFDNLI